VKKDLIPEREILRTSTWERHNFGTLHVQLHTNGYQHLLSSVVDSCLGRTKPHFNRKWRRPGFHHPHTSPPKLHRLAYTLLHVKSHSGYWRRQGQPRPSRVQPVVLGSGHVQLRRGQSARYTSYLARQAKNQHAVQGCYGHSAFQRELHKGQKPSATWEESVNTRNVAFKR